MPGTKKTDKHAATKAVKSSRTASRMSLSDAMSALEKAGSAQTRKTWARHGAPEPMFGVSYAVLKSLVKRLGVDHELARALWGTGNFDARNLAIKLADPSRMSPADLGRWTREARTPILVGYVAQLASEGPHASALARKWSASSNAAESCAAWVLIGQMAMRDESTPEAWFEKRVAEIERRIHSAPNAEREAMNQTLIAIGCRSAALRKTATAAARRIGKVEVDHGDTACKTPDAASYIDKTWAHSESKGFTSPAAHERSREPMRLRC
jgi:3-methyladenine DNA glycosylase AlkD